MFKFKRNNIQYCLLENGEKFDGLTEFITLHKDKEIHQISFLNEMASNYGKDDTNLEFIIWLLANDNYPHGIRIKVQFDGVRHVVHFPKDLSNIDDIVINKRLDERIFGKDKRNLKKFILNNIDLLNEIWDDKYNNLSKSYILKRIKKVKIK